MCLIPTQTLREIGLSLPLFIKWDDSEFGLRARRGGLPDGDAPRCRGVAHPVDRQERRARLAGLLPPPQPARSQRCCTRRTPGAGRWSGRASTHSIKHLVSMQYSTVELRHQALEDVFAGSGATARRRCRPVLPEINALPQAVHRRRSSRPTARPSRRPGAASRRGEGKDDDTEIPGRASLLITAALAPIRQLSQVRPLSREYPGDGDRRDGRQVVPAGQLRLRRGLDARRHVRGALPARPRATSATCSGATSRSTGGSTASGRGSPPRYRDALGAITSPRGVGEDLRRLDEEPE